LINMCKIAIVFCKAQGALPDGIGGYQPVTLGEHRPADDPLVRRHPDAFSPDPRFGMRWSGEPPEYMALPPDAPIPVEMTARAGERRPGMLRRG
jgi:hypothetical protein